MNAPGTRSALILHPDFRQRLRLRHLLRQAGCGAVREAESAAEAMQLLAEEPADLILFSWRVDGQTALEWMRSVRRHRHGRGAALVLLDEAVPTPSVVAAVKTGLAGRLRTPWRADDVAALLAELGWTWTDPVTGT